MDKTGAFDLAVELGYQIQLAGGEIYRVEESITRLLRAYGMESQVFAIPNCLTVSVTRPDGKTVTQVRRVPTHGTDIEKLEALNDLCRQLCRVPLPPAEATKEMKRRLETERKYRAGTVLAAYFLGAGAFALFFGGTLPDGFAAGLCGVIIGLTQRLMEHLEANMVLKTIAAGAASGLLALGLVALGLGHSSDIITIGALMILVPGVALTNAVRDLMVGDMISGISKLGEAVLIAIAIALGTAVALAVASFIGGL